MTHIIESIAWGLLLPGIIGGFIVIVWVLKIIRENRWNK